MRQKIRIMVFRIKKGRKREKIPWRPVAVPCGKLPESRRAGGRCSLCVSRYPGKSIH